MKIGKETNLKPISYRVRFLSLLVAFIILIFVGYILYVTKVFLQVWNYPMYYQVGDTLGVNTDKDALHFGRSYPGGEAVRGVNITNSYDFPVTVSIKVKGELAAWTRVSDNDFVLEPGEKVVLEYFVRSPGNAAHGNYTGTTVVVIRRALFN